MLDPININPPIKGSLMLRHLFVLCACCSLAAQAQDPAPQPTPSAVEPAILQSVEDKYTADVAKAEILVTKAETELAKAKQLAAGIRLKAYKDRLVEITKKGDFDKAVAVKARIEQLEKEPTGDSVKAAKLARPKDVVKFGGHSYALIKEPATWHIAKQRCEEMGGHLVCINNTKESEFVTTLCGQKYAAIGISDEIEEGTFLNLDGTPPALHSELTNAGMALEHWVVWDGTRFVVWQAGGRGNYVCEWER